ncbi:MAG: YSIRK-type signal peptide-containing protein [Bacteroides sp.]|nr:YSIRK-type signal peptide-containing protein [Bacteroides sp.]
MLSKHNSQERLRQMEQKSERFSIRKLSVGAASVLIGLSFLGFNAHSAKAATTNDNITAVQKNVTNTENTNVDNKSTAAVDANQVQAQQNTATTQVQQSQNTNTNQTQKEQAKPQIVPTVQANIPTNFNNSVQVSNWDQFSNAFKDSRVDQIVLNNDINVDGRREKAFTQRGIARTVEITSKDATKPVNFNFGDHFISTWDNNQRGTNQNWNIIFKDVNITSTDKVFTPIFTNNNSVNYSKRNTVTYSNVNYTGHQFSRSDATNIVLDGNVNINSVLESGDYSAITAYSVKVTDGSNVVMNVKEDPRFSNNSTQFLWGNSAVHTFYNDSNDAVVIGSGATFKFNPNQAVTNTKGFIFKDKANMIIAENAHVDMNMGDGNSTAILAPRQLTVKKGAVLNITTKQDNNGSHAWGDNNNGNHVAPISLGNLKGSHGNTGFDIENDATVRIVRTQSGRPAVSPLISFGSTGENPYNNYTLNVADGATLDLQDAGQSNWHEYGDKLASYLGNPNDLALNGLIAMYGIRSVDNLNFGNVKYVNLQRTGYQHGILIRLEGGHNISGSNAVNITGNAVPLEQWSAGNHSDKSNYSWDVDRLYTENKMGNYAYNYNGKGQKTGNNPSKKQYSTDLKFDQTSGFVSFADRKGLNQHSDFNDNFNWWKAQRIAFGSQLAPDASKYFAAAKSEVVTHVGANINTPSLNPNNIELTWKDKNGNAIAAPTGYKVSWKQAPATSAITNETAELVITFKDNSTETIKVPVTVKGATAINGNKVYQGEAAPKARLAVNTKAVDSFGISGMTWAQEPNTNTAGAAIPGVVKVDYSDGTSQLVNVTIDVIGVEKGTDHKDDTNLYRVINLSGQVSGTNGQDSGSVEVIYTRNRLTDYAYPVGNPKRVTYTKWERISEN